MSVFNAEDNDPQNFLEQLVGDDKKFKTPEELAKGKYEADRHIERLEQQMSELRADLSGRESLEELLRKVQQPNTPNPNPEPPRQEAHQPAEPALTDDQLAAKVQEILNATRQQDTVRQNVEAVANKLIEVYGSEDAANNYVKQRAQELGVSVQFLQDVAAKSPQAFFATVGVSEPKTPPGPTHGDVNTAALKNQISGQAKQGTYQWYQELRKSNPSLYHDPKTQMAMHKAAIDNPEAFFNRT